MPDTTQMHLVPWSRKDTTHAAAFTLTKRQIAEIIKQIGAKQAARYIRNKNIVLAYLSYE